jgi:hypothetical protein
MKSFKGIVNKILKLEKLWYFVRWCIPLCSIQYTDSVLRPVMFPSDKGNKYRSPVCGQSSRNILRFDVILKSKIIEMLLNG